jgi:hypothetical protein
MEENMPIQLTIFDRRDSSGRLELGNAAFALCKAVRSQEGIISSRYYWNATDTIVILSEGSTEALDSQGSAEFIKAAFDVGDMARLTLNLRLMDPQVGVENYRMAGRS